MRSRRRQWIPAVEIMNQLSALGPDRTGWAGELHDTLADTTDDLSEVANSFPSTE